MGRKMVSEDALVISFWLSVMHYFKEKENIPDMDSFLCSALSSPDRKEERAQTKV